MTLTGFKAVRVCVWLIAGAAVLGTAEQLLLRIWAGVPLSTPWPQLGLIASAVAIDHLRRLMAAQSAEIAALRAAATRVAE